MNLVYLPATEAILREFERINTWLVLWANGRTTKPITDITLLCPVS